jgi:hypothetical protein
MLSARLAKEMRTRLKICEYAKCGKTFKPVRSDQKYHSDACKNAARALRDAQALFKQKQTQATQRLINIGVGAKRAEWLVHARRVATTRSSASPGLCFLATNIGMLVFETTTGALEAAYGHSDCVVHSRSDDRGIMALLSQERLGASFIVQESERDFHTTLKRQIAKNGGPVDVWLLRDEWSTEHASIARDKIEREIEEHQAERAERARQARYCRKLGIRMAREECEPEPRITFVSYDAAFFEDIGIDDGSGRRVLPRIIKP